MTSVSIRWGLDRRPPTEHGYSDYNTVYFSKGSVCTYRWNVLFARPLQQCLRGTTLHRNREYSTHTLAVLIARAYL